MAVKDCSRKSGEGYEECCLGKDSNLDCLLQASCQELQGGKVKDKINQISLFCESDSVYNSIEEIFNSIRNEGLIPFLEYEWRGYCCTYFDVALVCKHARSEESRTYLLRDDGKYEWIESRFGLQCPFCVIDLPFSPCPFCVKKLPYCEAYPCAICKKGLPSGDIFDIMNENWITDLYIEKKKTEGDYFSIGQIERFFQKLHCSAWGWVFGRCFLGIYDSMEEIIESIREVSLIPFLVDERKGYCGTYFKIALVCKHAWSEESRTYLLRDDGKYEWVKSEYELPCLFCSKEFPYSLAFDMMTKDWVINMYTEKKKADISVLSVKKSFFLEFVVGSGSGFVGGFCYAQGLGYFNSGPDMLINLGVLYIENYKYANSLSITLIITSVSILLTVIEINKARKINHTVGVICIFLGFTGGLAMSTAMSTNNIWLIPLISITILLISRHSAIKKNHRRHLHFTNLVLF